MIIGISGKIGSGKDTVATIIQYLVRMEKDPFPQQEKIEALFRQIREFGLLPITNQQDSGWEIKKFAEKLKQIMVLLTGCKREDLESQEFKNKQLSEEWKVQFRDYVWEDLPEHIKKERSEMLMLLPPDRKVRVAEEWIPTYRWLMQQIGTEAMRDLVHTNVWVNALFADYKPLYVAGVDPYKTDVKSEDVVIADFYPNWIISDMRFPNEMKAIEDRGGITIRVNRDWDYSTGVKVLRRKPGVPEHPSETSLDDATFNHVIENDGTIEELVEKVKAILVENKILS